MTVHKIVIVGGGAGGLELATQLGDSLGKNGKAQIILIDQKLTHLWKPWLHQYADWMGKRQVKLYQNRRPL